MNIDEFCQKLETQLAAKPAGEERLKAVAQALSQAFRVTVDEVAVFVLDAETQVLRFRWPLKLKTSGLVPLSSAESLVARTARENKAFLNNRFASAAHTSIFEHFRLGSEEGGRPLPIQKIISAPLAADGGIRGVVQVCRKGADAAAAGGDFGKPELSALVKIARVVARHI
ncbi:hypothetical protein DESUT3_01110 [Desulfuromonas versatilis]|uniref:GAF domain-containing protein n=1 Tax=Desulfuromonas versatilis TaxID=2802975 RepID=A0ABN6DS56_9BACT|nr:hypothetical protein [Desulfuromonas versatilis]BCR03042.1 hypothetical protein DESUT3_01110 [Desulfuromonas versatilis]